MKNTSNHSCFLVKNARAFVLLFFMLVICNRMQAQEVAMFNIKFTLDIKDGDFKNAVITITKNGAPYRVIDPDKGKYTIALELGGQYLITCTKMGYITKSVAVDTRIPPKREAEPFIKFLSTVELLKQPEDAEVTYNQPVGRIKYSMETADFDFDKDYTAQALEMQKKANASPIPKPKPPTPNPRPTPPPVPVVTTPKSNPIPVVVKQPEYKPEPPKPKPVVVQPDIPQQPIVKNKVEKVVQKDRLKITFVIVTINGFDYEYRKEEYAWGGTYYYKGIANVTCSSFEQETGF
jgi:hypothetical protein